MMHHLLILFENQLLLVIQYLICFYFNEKFSYLELIITQLFDPESTLNPEHRPKYIALLAYACSVAETNKKVKFEQIFIVSKSLILQSSRKSTVNSKEELSQTTIALEKAHEICVSSKSTVDLISDLNELYKCLR
jgi:negative elongation factor C/D